MANKADFVQLTASQKANKVRRGSMTDLRNLPTMLGPDVESGISLNGNAPANLPMPASAKGGGRPSAAAHAAALAAATATASANGSATSTKGALDAAASTGSA